MLHKVDKKIWIWYLRADYVCLLTYYLDHTLSHCDCFSSAKIDASSKKRELWSWVVVRWCATLWRPFSWWSNGKLLVIVSSCTQARMHACCVAVVCLCLKQAISGVVSQWKRNIRREKTFWVIELCCLVRAVLSLMGVCGFIVGTSVVYNVLRSRWSETI